MTPRICRTENFIPFHTSLRELLAAGPIVEAASALLEEPAVLYKEKIAFKPLTVPVGRSS